ncbi:hypothetical protein POTOM_017730 [Populus tomentosa]|uniref:Uncharacterized protein n=1 Tax=Populus tomentosa TaxID=118781 RepID=A0A8X8D6X1_POPTO|nr:hypothetical protein POTOM_017730 [Populus tomentosa]
MLRALGFPLVDGDRGLKIFCLVNNSSFKDTTLKGPEKIPQQVCDEHSLEIENFPAEVNSTVTFRCFRVSSIDESVDQFAYQTSVNIGGRVFKGILYDQGPHESRYYFGESSSRQLQEPNLPSADALTPGALASTSGAAESLAHPSYPFPLNASMSGTQLFLHPKS